MDEYTEIELIGEGTFGKVFKATNKSNNIFAIKRISIQENGITRSTIREVKALKKFKNKNIVKLNDIYFSGDFINLSLEYLPYDLSGLLNIGYKFTDLQIESIFGQIIESCAFIHSKGFIHRDIKPSNILLDKNGTVKLADFGLCREKKSIMTNKVCTTWYRAPELLLGDSAYDEGVDSWGIACVMLELKIGHAPFRGSDEISQILEILEKLGRPEIPHLWDDLFDISKYPIIYNWEDKIKELFGEYFEGNLFTILVEMLRLNKAKRLSCKNAIKLDFIKKSAENLIPIIVNDSHNFNTKRATNE